MYEFIIHYKTGYNVRTVYRTAQELNEAVVAKTTQHEANPDRNVKFMEWGPIWTGVVSDLF